MLENGQSVVVSSEKQLRRPDLVYPAPGDLFQEHYWRTRWYSVLKVASAQGASKGWYGNIASPVMVTMGRRQSHVAPRTSNVSSTSKTGHSPEAKLRVCSD
jgi:hypothetical protein